MLFPFLFNIPSDDDFTDFVNGILERDYELFRSIALSQLDGDEDAADECIHAMLDIARKKKGIIYNHPKPAAYLTITLKNCIKKQIDKRARQPVFLDISTLADILPAPDDDFGDEDVVPDSVIEDAKAQILSRLTEDEYRLYKMLCTDKLPEYEIAERLGISYAAARTRIKRLKIKVRMLAEGFFK